jgi:hypothetical protein
MGELARWRDRPRSVLDSSALSDVIEPLAWLRCLVRPRMISETCIAGLASKEGSDKTRAPSMDVCILVEMLSRRRACDFGRICVVIVVASRLDDSLFGLKE